MGRVGLVELLVFNLPTLTPDNVSERSDRFITRLAERFTNEQHRVK